MSEEHAPGNLRVVNKPGHWAHGQTVEVIEAGASSSLETRSQLVEVRFPDSLGHGSERFEPAELLAAGDD